MANLKIDARQVADRKKPKGMEAKVVSISPTQLLVKIEVADETGFNMHREKEQAFLSFRNVSQFMREGTRVPLHNKTALVDIS